MKTTIIPIGNFKGIRIPDAILEQCHIKRDVTLETEGSSIIIKPVEREIRKNWEVSFKKMHSNKDDQLIIEDKINLDMANWEW